MKMDPITLLLLAGAGYYLYEKRKNPAWSPFGFLLSTPADRHLALEQVKITSVPTPSSTVALDPNMSSDQVKQVNQSLTTETDASKIAAHAKALSDLGHDASAKALAAKAVAVNEAKAHGASDSDLHKKQSEAVALSAFEDFGSVPVDAPMAACEAQVLLNALLTRQGHSNVEGLQVPIPVTNEFDADTAHLVSVFQAEANLDPTGTIDSVTAKALRTEFLSPPSDIRAGWGPMGTHGWGYPWGDVSYHYSTHDPVYGTEWAGAEDVMTGWGPMATGYEPRGDMRHHEEHRRGMQQHEMHRGGRRGPMQGFGRIPHPRHPGLHLHHPHHHPMQQQGEMAPEDMGQPGETQDQGQDQSQVQSQAPTQVPDWRSVAEAACRAGDQRACAALHPHHRHHHHPLAAQQVQDASQQVPDASSQTVAPVQADATAPGATATGYWFEDPYALGQDPWGGWGPGY